MERSGARCALENLEILGKRLAEISATAVYVFLESCLPARFRGTIGGIDKSKGVVGEGEFGLVRLHLPIWVERIAFDAHELTEGLPTSTSFSAR